MSDLGSDEIRCHQLIWRGWSERRCSRTAWKDGYCKQHHPDSVKKRAEESERIFQEQRDKSPLMRLAKALKRIEELEAEVKRLWARR